MPKSPNSPHNALVYARLRHLETVLNRPRFIWAREQNQTPSNNN